MTNEERLRDEANACDVVARFEAKRGTLDPNRLMLLIADALAEERRRVGEEILTGPRHELCETFEERVRRICRVEDGDE